MSNYATIKPCDIANGPGVRVSVFLSGCTHRCFGCFNESAWDFNYGQEFNQETLDYVLSLLNHDYIQGLTLLGGEPLDNEATATWICKEVKKQFPNKDIWLYTGYTFEDKQSLEIMNYIDIIVDGKFIASLKDLMLKFRGSSNQRIIDVRETLKKGTIVDVSSSI